MSCGCGLGGWKSKSKSVRAKIYYSKNGHIFGERSFSSCAEAKAVAALPPMQRGVRARVVCKKLRSRP